MASMDTTQANGAHSAFLRVLGSLLLLFTTVACILIASTGPSLTIYIAMLFIITLSILMINLFNIIHADSLFVLFYIYAVALGPIAISLRGGSYSYDYYSLLLIPLSLFGLGNLIGAITYGNIHKRKKRSKAPLFKLNIKRRTILYCLFILSLVVSLYYLFANRSLFIENFASSRISAASGNGVIVYLMTLPIVVLPMLLDLYMQEDSSSNTAPSRITLIVLTILAIVALFISGFRANVVSMIICMLVLYCGKRKVSIAKMILFAVVLVILVGVLGVIRDGLIGSSFAQSFIIGAYVNGLNLQYVISAFPDRIPFQNGYTYLINLQMLLPGPDLDFTLWLKEQLGLSFSGGGVTPTIVGELYINFGYVGVGVGSVILGFLGTRITRYFESSEQSFFAVFLVWEFAHCVSGGIANVMIPVLVLGIAYAFIKMVPIDNSREKLSFVAEKTA